MDSLRSDTRYRIRDRGCFVALRSETCPEQSVDELRARTGRVAFKVALQSRKYNTFPTHSLSGVGFSVGDQRFLRDGSALHTPPPGGQSHKVRLVTSDVLHGLIWHVGKDHESKWPMWSQNWALQPHLMQTTVQQSDTQWCI